MIPTFSIPRLQLQRVSPSVQSGVDSSRSEKPSSSRSDKFERASTCRSLPSTRAVESVGVAVSSVELLGIKLPDFSNDDHSEDDTFSNEATAWVDVKLAGPNSDAAHRFKLDMNSSVAGHQENDKLGETVRNTSLDSPFFNQRAEDATSCCSMDSVDSTDSLNSSDTSSSCSASTCSTITREDESDACCPSLQLPSLQDLTQERNVDGDPRRGLALNLAVLDDKEPEIEGQDKRQKLAFFERHMSEVYPGIFVIGEHLAKDRQALDAAGITHVINCIGMVMKPQFPDSYKYLTLHLLDHSGEDIASLLYLVMNFIQAAMAGGGKVCIHCSQGVSRSVTLAIAYIMWQTKHGYQQVFKEVKAIRGVANPNLGFASQLMRWEKLQARQQSNLRAFRIMCHTCTADSPFHLVAREIREPISMDTFQPDNVVIVRTSDGSYVWKGPQSRLSHQVAARRTYFDMIKYEGAPYELQGFASLDALPAPVQAALCQIDINYDWKRMELQLPRAPVGQEFIEFVDCV